MSELSSYVNKAINNDNNTGTDVINSRTQNTPSSEQIQFVNKDLEEPLNWTDPIVRHDPTFEKSKIAKIYQAQNALNSNEKTNDVGTTQQEDMLRVEGIYYPVIKLNNFVIDASNIESITLYYKDFLPTIDLWIEDPQRLFSFKDVPGQNNVITLIIIPPKNGAYKGISLDFFITAFEEWEEGYLLHYIGEYKILNFKQDCFRSITYPGCTNPLCNTPENKKCNMWELLHVIALENKLGFASTDGCREIEDRLPRLMQFENLYNFIQDNLKYSGLDENSFFDAWIDLYGYIVMVNVPWILTDNAIDIKHLSIITTKGTRNTSNDVQEQKFETVNRTLHNSNLTNVIDDLSIESYEEISKPGDMHSIGNLQTLTSFSPEGAQNDSSNNISSEQILAIEDSADGAHIEEYQTSTSQNIIINVSDYNINVQEYKRTLYFTKLRSKQLKIVLKQTNFGLQRGTLVNVIIYEYEPLKKDAIIKSSSNVGGQNETILPDDLPIGDMNIRRDVINNEGVGVPNPALNGLYYIDSMEFHYDSSKDGIVQTLYLIKKGLKTNLTNKHTAPRLADDPKLYKPNSSVTQTDSSISGQALIGM